MENYKIPLRGKYGVGNFAIVDEDDYQKVKDFKWYVLRNGYVVTDTRNKDRTKGVFWYLHRFLTNAPKDLVVDHINGDKFDNRKENLRVTTQGNNVRNQRIRSDNTSGYKGVSFCKIMGKWRTRIQYNKKGIIAGYFENKEDAARAYDNMAKELYGEFANLNLPEED